MSDFSVCSHHHGFRRNNNLFYLQWFLYAIRVNEQVIVWDKQNNSYLYDGEMDEIEIETTERKFFKIDNHCILSADSIKHFRVNSEKEILVYLACAETSKVLYIEPKMYSSFCEWLQYES